MIVFYDVIEKSWKFKHQKNNRIYLPLCSIPKSMFSNKRQFNAKDQQNSTLSTKMKSKIPLNETKRFFTE